MAAAKAHQTKCQQRCGEAKNNSISFRHVYLHRALEKANLGFDATTAMDKGTWGRKGI
jgi:hypothetical protein